MAGVPASPECFVGVQKGWGAKGRFAKGWSSVGFKSDPVRQGPSASADDLAAVSETSSQTQRWCVLSVLSGRLQGSKAGLRRLSGIGGRYGEEAQVDLARM